MKALTFLEWLKNDIINPSQLAPYGKPAPIEIAQSTAEQLVKIYEFYSQPFKPELITELFEGWDIGESQSSLYSLRYEAVGYALNLPKRNDPANGDYIDYETTNGECDFIYPQTLNDFISDCSRAGIELTFKQEVINKYFK